MERAKAVLAALAEEGKDGADALPGSWPERSCASLVMALCRALGAPEPAYAPWLALSEKAATVRVLSEYGSMGRAHQAGLVETGHWRAVDVREGRPEPGDVLSWEGPVVTANGARYLPPSEGCEATGVCGVYGYRWYWSKGAPGLSHVVQGKVSYITRAI